MMKTIRRIVISDDDDDHDNDHDNSDLVIANAGKYDRSATAASTSRNHLTSNVLIIKSKSRRNSSSRSHNDSEGR
jgi:hypothetical protein